MEIVNTQVNEIDTDGDDDDNVNDDDERIAGNGRRLMVAKRFPKWRSGDTRSRVRLLHQNDGRHQAINAAAASSSSSSSSSHHNSPVSSDYSALLRNRWENNMLEKNRMYQNLLG